MLTAQGYSTPAGFGTSSGPTETMSATVLFADLHGYLRLAEIVPANQVVPMLGQFFGLLKSAVLQFGGQVYQIAQARMMAGFGVGDSSHTRTLEALAAARAIQETFHSLRTRWQHEFSIDTGVGIGIHRGDVAIGVFGPPGHEAPTLVGDAANVAALLCNRARAGEVLLSAVVNPSSNMARAVNVSRQSVPFLHLPDLELRARSAPLDVWCVPAMVRLEMRDAVAAPHSKGLSRR